MFPLSGDTLEPSYMIVSSPVALALPTRRQWCAGGGGSFRKGCLEKAMFCYCPCVVLYLNACCGRRSCNGVFTSVDDLFNPLATCPAGTPFK